MDVDGTRMVMLGGLSFNTAGFERDAGSILESLATAVCICEAGGHVSLANQRFRSYPEVVQSRVGALCAKVIAAWSPSAPAGQQRRFQLRFRKSDRSFQVIVALQRGRLGQAAEGESAAQPAGETTRAVALVRDVTSRERLRRKLTTIDRAGSELLRLDAETVEQMHVADRLRMLEEKVIRFAHDLLNFDHFAVRLLNEKTGELELVMATGLSPKACAIKLHARPEANGISGFVAATGESYICPDVSKDPRYVYGLDQAGSSLTVPLKIFDRVIGVFNVESNTLNAFGQNDRQFAEIFGRYVAMALHILNLLLVERYTTSQKASGTVQGELSEPLNDLTAEAEALKDVPLDPEVARHVERIIRDVESIRQRIKDVARGPRTILGIDEAATRSSVDPALENRRVLVVDNDEEIATTIRDLLTRRGCAVTACSDGAGAQKLLLQWQLTQDPDQGFDLILSDINLGDATGYDVFAAAKAASPNVPVILMTGFGYDPHHSIVRASQEGLQCVLFKPFQVEKLVDEVKKAVARDGLDRVVPPL